MERKFQPDESKKISTTVDSSAGDDSESTTVANPVDTVSSRPIKNNRARTDQVHGQVPSPNVLHQASRRPLAYTRGPHLPVNDADDDEVDDEYSTTETESESESESDDMFARERQELRDEINRRRMSMASTAVMVSEANQERTRQDQFLVALVCVALQMQKQGDMPSAVNSDPAMHGTGTSETPDITREADHLPDVLTQVDLPVNIMVSTTTPITSATQVTPEPSSGRLSTNSHTEVDRDTGMRGGMETTPSAVMQLKHGEDVAVPTQVDQMIQCDLPVNIMESSKTAMTSATQVTARSSSGQLSTDGLTGDEQDIDTQGGMETAPRVVLQPKYRENITVPTHSDQMIQCDLPVESTENPTTPVGVDTVTQDEQNISTPRSMGIAPPVLLHVSEQSLEGRETASAVHDDLARDSIETQSTPATRCTYM